MLSDASMSDLPANHMHPDHCLDFLRLRWRMQGGGKTDNLCSLLHTISSMADCSMQTHAEHQAAKGGRHICKHMVRQVVNKCAQYWPTVKGDIMPQGNIMVKLESEVI